MKEELNKEQTNTYPYAREIKESKEYGKEQHLSEMTVQRYGYEKNEYFKKVTDEPESDTSSKRRKTAASYVGVEVERVPGRVLAVPWSAVLSAKPSPLPSSTSWGRPSEVPFLPGLLFPYFSGMIKGDVTFFKNMVARYFFRNLPLKNTQNPHDFYRTFKAEIAPFVYTEMGLAGPYRGST
jgi:hypothetical protein